MPIDETTRKERLDRRFRPITNFGYFSLRMDMVETEGEMVGLLYEGPRAMERWCKARPEPSVKPDTKADVVQELCKWVLLYLLWAEHEQEGVASAARQVLVKSWLRYVAGYTEYGGLLEVNAALLDFLIVPHADLVHAPYPRFVRQYLGSLRGIWTPETKNCSRALLSRKGTEELQSLTGPLVQVSLAWDDAVSMAAYEERGAEMLLHMKTFLVGREPKNAIAGTWLALRRGYDEEKGSYRDKDSLRCQAEDQAFSAMLYLLNHQAIERGEAL